MLAVAAIALSAGPVARTAPVTLVRTSAPIEAFAHDAPVIGWISGSCRGVHLQNLLTSSRATIGRASIAACDPTVPPHLAVAGQRALWTQTPVGNFVYVNVMVGSLSLGTLAACRRDRGRHAGVRGFCSRRRRHHARLLASKGRERRPLPRALPVRELGSRRQESRRQESGAGVRSVHCVSSGIGLWPHRPRTDQHGAR